MDDEDFGIEIKLKHNLSTLKKLEKTLREEYDDEEIFEQLELHKKSAINGYKNTLSATESGTFG